MRSKDEAIRQEKVEEARRRVESGYYESRHVKEEIARKIADELLE
jgi:hypothetical protein